MMDAQLITICLLTVIINLIGALAYSARIAGVRTGRIAVSFALFNILVLISRTSNGFLGPFLAKRIETHIAAGTGDTLITDFRLILASATGATILGALLIPTGQRLFSVAIAHFSHHRSALKLVLHAFTRSGIRYVRKAATLPQPVHLKDMRKPRGISLSVILLNVAAQALLTAGVLASLYAGYLEPDFRATASQLSAVVNGLATILLFALIDPQLSMMTDDVVGGRISSSIFRRTIVWLSLSRIVGTLVAQAILIPAAWAIVVIANRI